MARIVFDHLGKRFGNVVAVHDFNLEIADGEFVALLGPSGCGKTTTLLMLAGIFLPTEGAIQFDGIVVNDLPPQDRHVGMVFQSYALYPHMTVFDNIAFPLRLQRRPPDEIQRRVREVVGLVHIGGLLSRRPGELSGGQQQRVALARALVKQPTLLLLDEPLSNLDAKLRVLMRTEIKRLQRQLGITTILVTHDQVEAMTMADRIAILKDGVVQQIGSPDDVYARPVNTFVAGFIGSPPMNLLPARVGAVDGSPVLESDGLRVAMPERLRPRVASSPGRDVIVGVRPEDIQLVLTPSPGLPEGRILDVEPLGRELVVAVAVGGQYVAALTGPGFEAAPEQPVWLGIPPDRVHVFDGRTEAALP